MSVDTMHVSKARDTHGLLGEDGTLREALDDERVRVLSDRSIALDIRNARDVDQDDVRGRGATGDRRTS